MVIFHSCLYVYQRVRHFGHKPGLFHAGDVSFRWEFEQPKGKDRWNLSICHPQRSMPKSVGHLENPGNMREKEIRYIYTYIYICMVGLENFSIHWE